MRIGSSETQSRAVRTRVSTPREEGATQLADPAAMEELHHRENEGTAVSLQWSRHSRRHGVLVEDRKVRASFALNPRADNELEVFFDPYAHLAAWLRVVA
jgi:hypothetical protein